MNARDRYLLTCHACRRKIGRGMPMVWQKIGNITRPFHEQCADPQMNDDKKDEPTGYEAQGTGYDPGARGYELQGRAAKDGDK